MEQHEPQNLPASRGPGPERGLQAGLRSPVSLTWGAGGGALARTRRELEALLRPLMPASPRPSTATPSPSRRFSRKRHPARPFRGLRKGLRPPETLTGGIAGMICSHFQSLRAFPGFLMRSDGRQGSRPCERRAAGEGALGLEVGPSWVPWGDSLVGAGPQAAQCAPTSLAAPQRSISNILMPHPTL